MEETAPIRVLIYEGEFQAWLMRCPVDPADSRDRLLEVYAGLLEPKLQHLEDHELRALVFAWLRQAVIDTLCVGPGIDRRAVERRLPTIPVCSSTPDPTRAMQASLRREEAAVRSLPERCQRIFALHHGGQLTIAQIAARLKIEEAEVERELVAAVRACAAVAFSRPSIPVRASAASLRATVRRLWQRIGKRGSVASRIQLDLTE
jgi:DNA-directed RNA polymerase specialized sigma24 family protein